MRCAAWLLALLVVLAAAAQALAARAAGASLPRDLAWLVRTLDVAGPLTPAELTAIVAPLRCGGTSACRGGRLQLRNVVVGAVILRRYDGGSLLILDHVAGACVPPRAVVPSGATLEPPVNGCTDGITCLYRKVHRRWGKLSIGVSGAGATACIRSVVFERHS